MLTPHCDLGLRSQWFTFGVEGDLRWEGSGEKKRYHLLTVYSRPPFRTPSCPSPLPFLQRAVPS